MCQAIENFCTEALSKLLQPLWEKKAFMRPGYAQLPKSTGKLRSISIHRWMDSAVPGVTILYIVPIHHDVSSISFFMVNCMEISCMSMCCGAAIEQPSHEMFIVSTAPGSFHEIKKSKLQGPRRKNTMVLLWLLSLELCRWCRRCRIEFLSQKVTKCLKKNRYNTSSSRRISCCWSDSFHQNASFKWISAKWRAIAKEYATRFHG